MYFGEPDADGNRDLLLTVGGLGEMWQSLLHAATEAGSIAAAISLLNSIGITTFGVFPGFFIDKLLSSDAGDCRRCEIFNFRLAE